MARQLINKTRRDNNSKLSSRNDDYRGRSQERGDENDGPQSQPQQHETYQGGGRGPDDNDQNELNHDINRAACILGLVNNENHNHKANCDNNCEKSVNRVMIKRSNRCNRSMVYVEARICDHHHHNLAGDDVNLSHVVDENEEDDEFDIDDDEEIDECDEEDEDEEYEDDDEEEDDEDEDDEEDDDEEEVFDEEDEEYENERVNGYCSSTSTSCSPDTDNQHQHHHHRNHHHRHHNHNNLAPHDHRAIHQQILTGKSTSQNPIAQSVHAQMVSQFAPDGQTRVCDCCYCEVFGHGVSPMGSSRRSNEIKERLRQRLRKREQNNQRENLDDSTNDKGGGGDLVKTPPNINNNNNNSIPSSRKLINDDKTIDELLEFINGKRTKDQSLNKKNKNNQDNNKNIKSGSNKNKTNQNNKVSAASDVSSTKQNNLSSTKIANNNNNKTQPVKQKCPSKDCRSNNGSGCNKSRQQQSQQQNPTKSKSSKTNKTEDLPNNNNGNTTTNNNNNSNSNNNSATKRKKKPQNQSTTPSHEITPSHRDPVNQPNNTNGNTITTSASSIVNESNPDDIFMPKKDIDPNDNQLDDLERELEAFKRFCFDSGELVKKERVRLNLNCDLFKRPTNV